MANEMKLIVIWAEHWPRSAVPVGTPQFVAAFPLSLEEAMPDLFEEWVGEAKQRYQDEVDDPVRAFHWGITTIERPQGFEELRSETVGVR